MTLGRLHLSVADAGDLAEGALRGIGFPQVPRINAARLAHSHTIGNPQFSSAGKRSNSGFSKKEVAP